MKEITVNINRTVRHFYRNARQRSYTRHCPSYIKYGNLSDILIGMGRYHQNTLGHAGSQSVYNCFCAAFSLTVYLTYRLQ